MGEFLYIFNGYDVSDSILNSVYIERIRIHKNEAEIVQDPFFNSNYVVDDDICNRFTRCFTSVYPSYSGNKIIYFGYGGLEDNLMSPGDLSKLTKNDEAKKQKYQKYVLYDEFPKYNVTRQLMDEERIEYRAAVQKYNVSKCLILGCFSRSNRLGRTYKAS
jgi:hypothetical protein